jgi:putative FmdB family regulatory protein
LFGGLETLPLYEYECPKDGTFEKIQKFSDPPLKVCPTCGRPVEKLPSAPAIQFKGTGWYVTDYAKKSDGAGKKSGGKDKDAGGTDKGGTDKGGTDKGSSEASTSSSSTSSTDAKSTSSKGGDKK